MSESILHIEKISAGFGNKHLFHIPELVVDSGKLIVLIGRNGSGKTTLLRTLLGLEKPMKGELLFRGNQLSHLSAKEKARLVAASFSGLGSLPSAMRVHELIGIGRHPHTGWLGMHSATDEAAILNAARMTGVEAFLQRELGTLSDGEAQKASLARTLAQGSELILLDEPLAFLDYPSRLDLLKALKGLTAMGKAVIFSSHDLSVSLEYADQAWVIGDDRTIRGFEASYLKAKPLNEELFGLIK